MCTRQWGTGAFPGVGVYDACLSREAIAAAYETLRDPQLRIASIIEDLNRSFGNYACVFAGITAFDARVGVGEAVLVTVSGRCGAVPGWGGDCSTFPRSPVRSPVREPRKVREKMGKEKGKEACWGKKACATLLEFFYKLNFRPLVWETNVYVRLRLRNCFETHGRKEYDAAAREQEKKHVEERKPPEPTWEANVSAEHAREMLLATCAA